MVECTATVRMESRRQVRITRQAISPRLAMRTFANMAGILSAPRRAAGGLRLPWYQGTIAASRFRKERSTDAQTRRNRAHSRRAGADRRAPREAHPQGAQ